MNNKKVLVGIFITICLVQVFVPAQMIWHQEDIISTGSEYKFKVAPIDPRDFFRGNYIRLGYEESTIEVQNKQDWKIGDSIYVLLSKDDEGFAKIKSVSKNKPSNDENFIKAKVVFGLKNAYNQIRVKYPFDRLYMQEARAKKAQIIARKMQREEKIVYALVNVKNADFALRDVLIEGVSIKDIIKTNKY